MDEMRIFLCFIFLSFSSIFAKTTTVSESVNISNPNNPEAVGFNEGVGLVGIDWDSVESMKKLELTIQGGASNIMDSLLVNSDGIMWHEPPNNSECTGSKVWASSAIEADAQYLSLFQGKYCEVEGKGGEGKEPSPEWVAGVLSADIDADSDNDSTKQRPPTVMGSEAIEEEVAEQELVGKAVIRGLVLCLNANFEEEGQTEPKEDYEKIGIFASPDSDPHLVQGLLTLKFPSTVKVKASLDYGPDIKVYISRENGQTALIPSGIFKPVETSPSFTAADMINPNGTFSEFGKIIA